MNAKQLQKDHGRIIEDMIRGVPHGSEYNFGENELYYCADVVVAHFQYKHRDWLTSGRTRSRCRSMQDQGQSIFTQKMVGPLPRL